MPDREKVIRALECCLNENVCPQNKCADCPYRETDIEESCIDNLQRDSLAILKEQQEQIDRLIEENASNAEMAEGLKELLKEQEAVVKQWTKEIADYQLAHAPNDSPMSLDEQLECEYKRGIWDGLQIAWNIISEGR